MTKLAGLILTFGGVFTHAVDAHSLFTNLYVNNANQGDGTCIRMPKNPSTSTYPVTDLQDSAMVCGFDGTNGVQRVCSVPKGSQLGFEYRLYPDGKRPGSIEPSHKGPCAVYMKAVASAPEATGEGDGWFKVWDEGYDSNAGKWCSDKVIENNGILNVNLPRDLAGGNYLVRSELLALQEADKSPPEPQFYIGCAQINLVTDESSGPTTDTLVSIPGHVRITDPSVHFNIYLPQWPYTVPGPKTYSRGVPTQRSMSASHNKGLLPPKTVAVNGNWWGTEQDSYNSESGCWNATQNCYNQLQTCYDSAPATGSKGCKVYEGKCSKMQSGCRSGDFNGPPDQGMILTDGVKGNLQTRDVAAVDLKQDTDQVRTVQSFRGRLQRHWKRSDTI
ncbi:putative endo-beta-1,4-glucanase D [Golovinomyces cichoracearum]|uniref:AA9 family lytic polysaccharide monooxygenase n=1 Tax=Golovinomyces cichoracearum TaxID=62708 RepID=A0A420H9D6_9PEZI|nr:putative endo-beta-1,4-glucanase D [Golovinomyces cichoracearum]